MQRLAEALGHVADAAGKRVVAAERTHSANPVVTWLPSALQMVLMFDGENAKVPIYAYSGSLPPSLTILPGLIRETDEREERKGRHAVHREGALLLDRTRMRQIRDREPRGLNFEIETPGNSMSTIRLNTLTARDSLEKAIVEK